MIHTMMITSVQLAAGLAKVCGMVLLAINAKELVAIQNSTGMTIMSKQIDALKLALEALRMPIKYWNKTQYIKVIEAIEVAEEALAQPEQEPVAWFWKQVYTDGYEWKHMADNQADADKFLPHQVIPLYTTPPQPKEPKQEQGEPVAVVTGVYGGRFTYAPIKASVILPVGMALYTRPQPLTLRNDVLEEVAKEFDRMTSLGDTAASFACDVRGMKG